MDAKMPLLRHYFAEGLLKGFAGYKKIQEYILLQSVFEWNIKQQKNKHQELKRRYKYRVNRFLRES